MFTHLHVHSEYSLLDGLAKIPKLIAKTAEYGMKSLALTDHGVMYGAVPFYLACLEAEIKPIIGVEAYMAHRSRFDKQPRIDADQYHLVLLAKDNEGYKNLLKLTTIAHLEGFYYKPRLDLEALREHSQGLICLSACVEGEIPSLIIQDKKGEALKKAGELLEIFGKDFYLEIQSHPKIANQDKANRGLVEISRQLGIPLVATNDVHYVEAGDAEAQDALLAIQTQKKIADKKRLTMLDSPDFYFRSPEEMESLFKDFPDALENTQEIALRCNLEIEIGRWILPHYPLPVGETGEKYLRQRVAEELPKRYPQPSSEVKERLNYELEIICKKGFATYFLIVADLVNWAKQEGIRVGPGRGSGAGSLVSYVLRITSLDPLVHELPFERFLNPERPSPPDIDLDFADDRRDEVIEYVRQKYGPEKVAQIITFGTMEARLAIRDVCRVLGYPYSVGDRLAKMIPVGSQGFSMTIENALKTSPELALAFQNEPETKKILDLASRVEGVARHASTHAAGLVIADKELTDYTPLQRETKGTRIITQYDMKALDLNSSEKAIGLLKIDLLGLRNLTILEKGRDFVKALKGIEVDLSEIPLDDSKVYEMISRGETTGVFQLESAGMRRLAKGLKPARFSDIAAMVALFRPGPMQWINEFIAAKEDPSRIRYFHPDLKPILEETYGIAVFQEQCLRIAVEMAGYTWGEADSLRRAIGKKKKVLMEKERVKFIKKIQEKGYSKEIAEKTFALIERFVGYGFNKSHATCYAMIAYQTAWMKANYPVEFMAAFLTAESVNADKIALGITECRQMGIMVLPPNINKSGVGFTIEERADSLENYAIRFGLSAIKNVGKAAILEILKTRELAGEFKSLSDFCQRADSQKVNKKVLESLIRVGGMDGFGRRAAMVAGLDKLRSRSESRQRQTANGQTSFFHEEADPKNNSGFKDDLPEIEEFSKSELLSLERDLLGFYLTEHPFSSALSLLEEQVSHKLYELSPEIAESIPRVRVGGVVSALRIILTRDGRSEMAFAQIEDDTGRIEAVIFPRVFALSRSFLAKDSLVVVEGRLEAKEEALTLLVEKISPVSTSPKLAGEEDASFDFVIKVPAGTRPKILVELNKLLKENTGEKKGVLVFEHNGESRRLVLTFGVNFTPELEEEIKELLISVQS